MSVLDKIREKANGVSAGPTVAEKQREKYPLLAGLLEGTSTPSTKGAPQPWTLSLFADEGQVRFSVGSRSAGMTFFGSAGVGVDVLGSIEKALVAGEVVAKREKEVFGGAKY